MEINTVSDRYYVRNSIMPFNEDDQHEFKGHRNIAVEEIPPFAKPGKNRPCTRKAISRVINAFLNSGKGGTVYLGVTDQKQVCGLPMSHFQKEHLVESVADLMSRYQYPVKLHRLRVQFVPVVENFDSKEVIAKQMAFTKKPPEPRSTTMPHQLRTHKPCWCDNECSARNTMGFMSMTYVVEIVVSAWDPDDVRNTDGIGKYNVLPLCGNEEGKYYLRKGVNQVECTPQEAIRILHRNIDKRAEEELERMEKEIAELEEDMMTKGIPLPD